MSARASATACYGVAIDRGSPVPLYFQVAEQLAQAIQAGRLTPGERMANELELADALAVSRPTMRRAMEYLVDKGLVVRQRGVGTRVVSPSVRRTLSLTSLHDDLAAAGQRPTTRVLANRVVDATVEIAARLGLTAGEPVREIVRLRSAQDRPIAHMTNHLPAWRFQFDTDDLEADGLYALLRRAGVMLHSATQEIGARAAIAAEAKALGERRGAPVLTMARTAFDDHGVVVEYGAHLYAATRYTFQMNLLST